MECPYDEALKRMTVVTLQLTVDNRFRGQLKDYLLVLTDCAELCGA